MTYALDLSGGGEGSKILPFSLHFWAFSFHPLPLPGCPSGLHSHHISQTALDGPAAGVRRQQELHSGCTPGGVPLGARHLHRGVQKVLPPRSHCGKQTHSPLLQWHSPVCPQVTGHLWPQGWRGKSGEERKRISDQSSNNHLPFSWACLLRSLSPEQKGPFSVQLGSTSLFWECVLRARPVLDAEAMELNQMLSWHRYISKEVRALGARGGSGTMVWGDVRGGLHRTLSWGLNSKRKLSRKREGEQQMQTERWYKELPFHGHNGAVGGYRIHLYLGEPFLYR